MKAHYEIDSYPNLMTQLFVICSDKPGRVLVSDRMNLAQAQKYVGDSYIAHGLHPEYEERVADGVRVYVTQPIEVEEADA
jgi:hypothetical protein